MNTFARIAETRSVGGRSMAWIACGLCLALALSVHAAEPLSRSQVTVSKPAASLPGPTYTWVAMPQVKEVEKDARLQDPQLRARLQAALDKALQAKGYRPAADPAKADFIVAYRVGVRESQQATLQGDQGATPLSVLACDWDTCSQLVVMNDSTPTMKVVTTEQAEGGLLIEVIEPRTVRVLWRALNRGEVKRGDGQQAALDAIAANTLARLPANSK
ncbi:MAG: DUF4136 domain-containing protein [Pseudoxanthomonas sp.]